MATEVKIPDVGEGIDDVTIVRWLVQEGDPVKEGEILLEIATDKVDTEVPAPAGGVLLKRNFGEGELVAVTQILAYIGEAGEAPGGQSEPAEAMEEGPAAPASAPETADESGRPKATPVAQRVAQEQGIQLGDINGTGTGGKITKDDVLAHSEKAKSPASPAGLPGELANVASLAVQRAAAQYGLDLQEVAGDRPLSSLTKHDVLSAAESRRQGQKVMVRPGYGPPTAPQTPAAPAAETAGPSRESAPASTPASAIGEREELVPVNRMRQLTARSVSQSVFTAPHVTTMWDVDMTPVLEHRAAHRREFDAAGVKLTVTPYLILAILEGLKAVPAANSSWTDDGVVVKRVYNIGMAVALPQDAYGMGGLIVPVIHNADELNLIGLSRAVNDLAARARSNQLKPADIQGGTFTLSNYGVSGSRFQTPIIVQPQAGILGVGAIEKRPVVVSQGHPLEPNRGDYLIFKPMTTLGFSYDHRILDGATADAFCAAVKQSLEGWTPDR